jgi:branched-chain amino acid aminotransferase
MKVYIDGAYYEKEEARVSVFDHGLLYGDGVFEGIRIYNGRVFELKEHIRRLFRSAKAIFLTIPLDAAMLERAVIDTVRMNQNKNGYIRLVVTRGAGTLGIDPMKCPDPSLIIIVDDIELYPKEYYEKGIDVVTASTRRMATDSLDPRIKSLNYLNNVLAKLEARSAGCLEAVMLDRNGFIAECTGDNIFLVRAESLETPRSYHGALDGITKATVMEIAQSLAVEVQQGTLTRYDLYNADECFLTGTGAEIMPVVRVDGRTIGDGTPGELTKRLMGAFADRVTTRGASVFEEG